MSGPISSDGMAVVCSAGPEKERLPPYNERLEIVERSTGLPRTYKCGHSGAQWFRLHMYGEETVRIQQEEQCPECFLHDIKQHIIHCALCGLPIVPGDPVALYSATSPDLLMNIARVAREGVVVGCMRWDCCPSGGFFAGHWSEQGFEPAFSGRIGAGEAIATDEVIMVNI